MGPIIKKYLGGKASKGETYALLRWLNNKQNLAEFKKLVKDWETDFDEDKVSPYTLKELDKFKSKILEERATKIKKLKLHQHFYKYAAAILLVVALGGLYLHYYGKPVAQQVLYNTVLADDGQISKAILPDGTTVWLNSGSSIKYDNRFSTDSRDIILNGQAYFDVTKNAGLPFMVHSGNIKVKVLGTRFSVENYAGAPDISVVLVEGAVDLLPGNGTKPFASLKPDEMMVYGKSEKKYSITPVVAKQYTSWIEGIIYAYDQPLKDVLPELQKRYSQQIIIDKQIENYKVTFSIKDEDFLDFLKMIQSIAPVKAYQKGGVIYLNKK